MNEYQEPLVRYNIERNGLFFGYDRHGEDRILWLEWNNPFVCEWDAIHGVR